MGGAMKVVFVLYVVIHAYGEYANAASHVTCAFGEKTLMDGDLAMAIPEKCMMLMCRNGTITEEMIGVPEDTGCCMGFDGVVFPSAYESTTCPTARCDNGTWVLQESINPCCGQCQLYSYSHFTTFDSHHYDWHGICNYTLVAVMPEAGGNVTSGVFTEMNRAGPCATMFGHTTFLDHKDMIINITLSDLSKIDVNGVVVEIPEEGFKMLGTPENYTSAAYRENECLYVFGSSHLTLRMCPLTLDIWAHGILSGRLAGLCGVFNYNYTDDFTTPASEIMPVEQYPTEFPSTWRTDNQILPVCHESGMTTAECNGTKGNKCLADPSTLREYQRACEDVLMRYIKEDNRIGVYVGSCVTDLCLVAQRDVKVPTTLTEFFTQVLTDYITIAKRQLAVLKLTTTLVDPTTCSRPEGDATIPVTMDVHEPPTTQPPTHHHPKVAAGYGPHHH